MGSPPAAEPAELQSLKSMLNIARIIALIFIIIWVVVAIATFAAVAVALAFGFIGVIGYPILFVIWFIVEILIYIQIREIQRMVDRREYVQAKEKTLIWMIIGFILSGVIVGIFLLLAYIKYDPVINWQRSGYQMGPPPGMPYQPGIPPPPGTGPAASSAPTVPTNPAPPPSPATLPAAGATCPRCGRPATYIQQYNRYYCYADGQYV
jgi:hypothetical protein